MTKALKVLWITVLFACGLPAMAQMGLPRTAISVPADGPVAAGLATAEACKFPRKLTVMPAIPFDVAADGLADQVQAAQSASSNGELWLHVLMSGDSLSGNETEKQIAERVNGFLKSLPLASANVRGLVVEVREPHADSALYDFQLLQLALVAKSSKAGLRLGFVFQPGFIEHHPEVVKRLATYADLLGTTYSDGWQKDAAWITTEGLNKPLMLKLGDDTSLLTAELAASGTNVEILWADPADSAAAARACAVGSFMTRAIPGSMLRLDTAAVPFSVAVDGAVSNETLWFGSGESTDRVAVVDVHGSADAPKVVRLQGSEDEAQWFDPATGAQLTVGAPVTSEYVLIATHKKSDAEAPVFNAANVKTNFDLSVEEVVARWQQYREAQRLRLATYQASSFMNLHFESTAVIPAFDVSMRFKEFYQRAGALEFAQTEFYVNGVKFKKDYAFPLPELEPEKVLSQPLELKLTEPYVYKLLGTELVDGARCYVVSVEPKTADETLYSGRIWIDGKTFREVRQTLSQRGEKSNVVVNVETQNFALVPDGHGHEFNLLRSISAQQSLNAAGRDFLLQRTMDFTEYVINAPEFSGALEAEHASDDPMYRETDHGLRVLKKEGNARVVQETDVKRIRSLVGGAMYGGTFNFPIPFLGISISDFDYRHTGAQLSTFFAGPILATDLSKQYGNRYRLAADLALSALPGDNRSYIVNTEDKGAEVWEWSQTTGLRATWQATTHLSLTGSAYLEYDYFHTASDTADTYQLPRSGVSVLPGATAKYTVRGYSLTADVTQGERIAWRQFGYTAAPQPAQSSYTLYDADLNKDYYFRKFTKAGWDLSYYGGDQLDRFSRYFPSYFSLPRLHGIPSGTDTFDAIAMGNVHYGFNAMDLIKFEGMYSYARARNLDESSHYRLFDGLETNFSTAGPWGTLIQGTVSYALHGNIPRYDSRWGTTILIFKPLH